MKLTKLVQDLQLLTDKVPLLKPLLRPLAKFYYKNIDKTDAKHVEELRNAFMHNGIEVLDIFDKTLTSNGYKYSLAFGTMLGAVREHGFIKHDADIDTFMWIEDYDENLFKCLFDAGFKLKHSFLVENGKYAREDTVELKGVQIDIFYIYPALSGRQYSYCCDFFPRNNCRSWEQSLRKYGSLLPRRLEMPISSNVVRVPFERLCLPILENAQEFLSFRYGANFMTPNPKWTNGDNPYIIPWPEKFADYIHSNN